MLSPTIGHNVGITVALPSEPADQLRDPLRRRPAERGAIDFAHRVGRKLRLDEDPLRGLVVGDPSANKGLQIRRSTRRTVYWRHPVGDSLATG